MDEQNQQPGSLQDVKDIRRLMERSSRFISLSGLSGIAAGLCALGGAWTASGMLADYKLKFPDQPVKTDANDPFTFQLVGLAAGVFAISFLLAFYFTWRKSTNQGVPIWNFTSRRLFWNMVIPLVTGGFFILGMLQHNEVRFIAPASLIFYGLALVNASKYTLTDIRYLGFCEIILGLINMQWTGYGLYCWAIGFGLLHILYGIIMWWKYEKKP
jgi:hypothetical protein